MPIISNNIKDVLVVLVELERATVVDVDDFKIVMQAAIDSGNKKFIVDLSECEFIDSTFLSALVTILKKITKEDGDLKLVGLKPPVKSMFELTRLSQIFEIYGNGDEAVQSFN
jgi:anti-anti-sigma factor